MKSYKTFSLRGSKFELWDFNKKFMQLGINCIDDLTKYLNVELLITEIFAKRHGVINEVIFHCHVKTYGHPKLVYSPFEKVNLTLYEYEKYNKLPLFVMPLKIDNTIQLSEDFTPDSRAYREAY